MRVPSSGCSITTTSKHRKMPRWVVQRSRDWGCNGHQIPTKGPCRWKITRFAGTIVFSREDGKGGLRRLVPFIGDERRQGLSEVDRVVTAWEDNAHDRSMRFHRSGLGRRENVRIPRSCRAEPKTPQSVRAAQAAVSESGTREVRVHAIVRVAEVGRTHHASSLPRGRKPSWSRRR